MLCGTDRRFATRARARLLLALAALFLAGAGALRADDDSAARERERLEREIEERQEALDRLSQEEAAAPVKVEQVKVEQVKVEEEVPEIRQQAPEEDVSVGGSRRVRAGETSGGQVLVGGFYEVEKGALVQGDVTVVGGGAEVAGEVQGTLVVVGGSVRLRDDAKIAGDVVSIGGRIRDGGATVEGQKVQIAFGDLAGLGTILDGGPGSWRHDDSGWGFSFFELIGSLFRIGLLLVLVFAVWALAPERAARVAARVRREPWRSGLAGLIAEVIFLPLLLIVLVVLLVSIIGIPLALVVPPLMVVALIVFFVIGYAGVAMAAGGIFERRFERGYTRYALLLFGILLIEGWSLAGELLMALPGPIKFMAVLALAFGFLVEYVAWTVGLGAAVGDQVERRRLARARRGQPLAESRFVDDLDPQ